LEKSRPKPGRMEETLEGGRGPPRAVEPLEREREIFMSPAHILQTERWHVWAAPLFAHCYPTANESFENVYKLKFLNPTITKHFPNYAQDISVRNFTIPLKYTEDIYPL